MGNMPVLLRHVAGIKFKMISYFFIKMFHFLSLNVSLFYCKSRFMDLQIITFCFYLHLHDKLSCVFDILVFLIGEMLYFI